MKIRNSHLYSRTHNYSNKSTSWIETSGSLPSYHHLHWWWSLTLLIDLTTLICPFTSIIIFITRFKFEIIVHLLRTVFNDPILFFCLFIYMFAYLLFHLLWLSKLPFYHETLDNSLDNLMLFLHNLNWNDHWPYMIKLMNETN